MLLPPNLEATNDYLAGSDSERVHGLEWLLDRGARVLLASRGGYGVTRLMERLPWSRLVSEQVCVIGYSDLTALLNPLVAVCAMLLSSLSVIGNTLLLIRSCKEPGC